MDRINFLAKENFPLSTYTFDKMQNTSFLLANLALLGGKNYILAGCKEINDNEVSDGIIVIDGEIMPFEGGVKKDKIRIATTKESDHFAGVDYPEAYIFKKAVFANDGDYIWDDFAVIATIAELKKTIDSYNGDPIGAIKEWGGLEAKIPADYMLCDGRSLSKNDYPELYDAIGFAYGGLGEEFKLPDFRGRFAVGYDGSKEDYKAVGLTGGEEKHTLTTGELPAHDHVNSNPFNKLSARAADATTPGTASGVDARSPESEYNIAYMTNPEWESATIQKVGDNKPHENRPPYLVVCKIIKVK